jgi:phosphate transport system substrate-binding protein
VKKATGLVTAIVLLVIGVFALTTLTACGGDEADSPPSGGGIADNSAPDNSGTADNSASGDAGASASDEFNADRVIAVFTREDGSGTRDAFVSITGVGDDMYIEAVVQNGTSLILTSVETNETGIGYVSVGSLSPSVKALAIDGVLPSDLTIKDGSYALQRPFLVCVTDESMNNPLVQDFLDFMLSIEGQDLSATNWTSAVNEQGFYTPSGLTGTIKVGGSTSVEPLMQRMREVYINLNPGIEIEISGGGSGTGINEAIEGIIDIAMSSRSLRDNEKESLTDIAIALDGVAVIVNSANPVGGLSIEQVKEIFTGEKTRWNQVG